MADDDADADNEAAERERILRDYETPGHPTAFSAPARVARFHGISEKKAKRYLEHSQTYTLFREYKQPRLYNPYYVHERRKEVQADLIDVGSLARENDGVKFLLLYIDIFTKRVWMQPLRSKEGGRVARALRTWLASLDVKPEIFKTDLGREFRNQPVQDLLASNNVRWDGAIGTSKACMAERANKTLQSLIYKYINNREGHRYIDALPELVRSYNERGHRTLKGMSPAEADLPENEARVQAIFHRRYEKMGRARANRQRNARFKVGDLVRLKTEANKISSARRSYAQQFHGEYYRITRINRTLPIPMYYLRSLDTNEHIEGGLYAEQLQRVRGNVWLIERVHRREVRRGVPYIFVKWMWFGPRHSEWIREDAVTRAY